MSGKAPSSQPPPLRGGGEKASLLPSREKVGGGGAYRERLSPNVNARPPGTPIDLLVLHYTGMTSTEAAIGRLTDPASKVSCHWLIEEDGTVWRLAREEDRAWHAGVSFWAGATDINARSIGIELVNPGHEFGYRPFPEAQMAALEVLGTEILARHPIPPWRVVGHSDVAPKRKQDPGELFDWARLARAGIGIWPDADLAVAAIDAADGLRRIGYEVPGAVPDREAVVAFQRHFRPDRIDGEPDRETEQRIGQVAAAILHTISHKISGDGRTRSIHPRRAVCELKDMDPRIKSEDNNSEE